jgi:DNA-binding transcriptional MocR family regulator
MGQNPTSGVLSLQRRRDIYALCCKYDIIIVEDDPYWYLQYPSSTANTTTTAHPDNTSFNPDVRMFANGEPVPEGWKSSGYDFLDSIVPSSMNIDTEGRVIRLDTFSKTVAPGCRLGWLTAQPAFIERILRITETSTQQPSGFVQSIIAELLLGPNHHGLSTKTKDGKGGLPSGEGWKADGWIRWIEGLRGNYERRMQKMSKILDDGKYLVKAGRRNSMADADEWSVVEKTQIMSFDYPVGGMFLWLEILFETHPLYHTYKKAGELDRLSKAQWIYWTTKPYLVLISPGMMFGATEEIQKTEGWRYFRLCFAAINEDELVSVSERVRDGVHDFFRIKDKKTVEKLLEEDEEEAVSGRTDLSSLAIGLGGC